MNCICTQSKLTKWLKIELNDVQSGRHILPKKKMGSSELKWTMWVWRGIYGPANKSEQLLMVPYEAELKCAKIGQEKIMLY